MFIKNCFCFLSLFFSINCYADMNKCTDAKGNVMYSDKPCDTKSKSQSIHAKPSKASTPKIEVQKKDGKVTFQCDGRTRCPQMTSCEEAMFFLKNCPNVEMDGGKSDGIPCEKQWCSHLVPNKKLD